MAERIEILISGYGGQGVVRIGQILGQAAVNQGLYTTMLISHGTETRGGYVRSQVVISDTFIPSPVVERPDYFLAFSSIAYSMFKGLAGAHSLVLYDPDLVAPDTSLSAGHQPLHAETLARQELGDTVYANVIFLGALTTYLQQVAETSIVQALKARLPATHIERNLKAFRLGQEAILKPT